MANVKISELAEAGALTGTEEVPVVQAGATKRASILDIIGPHEADTTNVHGIANTANLATQADVTSAVNALIGGAPGALDTLNELAAAINDDASFAASVTTALAARATVDALNAHAADTDSVHGHDDMTALLDPAAHELLDHSGVPGLSGIGPGDVITLQNADGTKDFVLSESDLNNARIYAPDDNLVIESDVEVILRANVAGNPLIEMDAGQFLLFSNNDITVESDEISFIQSAMGFFGTAPVARPNAVTADDALEALGLATNVTAAAGGITGQGAGTNSVLVGDSAVASADQSLAIGDFASSTADSAIAIGSGTNTTDAPAASTTGAIAIGSSTHTGTAGARVTTDYGIAIGSGQNGAAGALASAGDAIAIGVVAAATGSNGIAIGSQSTASGSGSISLGVLSDATSTYSTAIGYSAQAITGTQAIAIGGGQNTTAAPNASGQGAIAIGSSNASGVNGARASGASSVAIGSGDASNVGARATASDAISIGRSAAATASITVAVGTGASAGGAGGVGIGNSSNALGADSVSIGDSTDATLLCATALGSFAQATGTEAIAIGGGASTTRSAGASAQGAIAIGGCGAAAGTGARASAANAIAIGAGDGSISGASATHATSVAIGKGSATTAANQIRLGTASEEVSIPGILRAPLTANRQTGSYTLVAADQGKVVEQNVAGANNLTVPTNATVAFPIGSMIEIMQYGAGQTTIVAAGGVTLRNAAAGLKLRAQYSSASLRKIAADEWAVTGDLVA